jgi:hypothetical protein
LLLPLLIFLLPLLQVIVVPQHWIFHRKALYHQVPYFDYFTWTWLPIHVYLSSYLKGYLLLMFLEFLLTIFLFQSDIVSSYPFKHLFDLKYDPSIIEIPVPRYFKEDDRIFPFL